MSMNCVPANVASSRVLKQSREPITAYVYEAALAVCAEAKPADAPENTNHGHYLYALLFAQSGRHPSLRASVIVFNFR
jgi:hypothetical protein